MNVNTTGAQAGGTINSTSASAINYTTAASVAATTAATTAETVALAINAGEATSATINVGAYTSVGGTVGVAKATDVTLNVATGKNKATPAAEVTAFTGTIDAAKAQSVVVDAKGNLTGAVINAAEASLVKVTTASDANTLTLNTAKATNVELTATKGLDLTAAATDLTGAEKVTVKANGGFVNLGTEALSKVNNLVVAGAAAASQFTVGALGSTTQDYAVNVTATGLKAGLSIGAVNSKADVSVDVAGTTGNNTITSIAANNGTAGAGGNVTLNAAGSAGSTTVGAITAGEGKTLTIVGNGILGKNASNNALDLGALNAAKGTIAINVKDTLNAVVTGAVAAKTVTIEADGLAKNLTVAGITAEDVTVKAAGALGTVGTGTITALKSVNYTGSETTANSIAITADNSATAAKDTLAVTVKGGIQADSLTLTSNGESAQGDLINATIDLGVGADTVTLVAGAGGFRSESTSLTNVETLLVTSTAGIVSLNASAVSGKTIVIGGTAASQSLTLAGTTAADTIDLTNVTAITGAGTNVATVRVEGGAGADTIKAGLASTIVGGAGNDVITAGAAVDTILFAGATSTAGAAGSVARVATLGTDSITGFNVAADILQFSAVDFGIAAATASALGAAGSNTDGNVYVVTAAPTATAVDLNGTDAGAGGAVVFVGATTGTGGVDVYWVANESSFTIAGSTKIATLVGINTTGLDHADVAFVA